MTKSHGGARSGAGRPSKHGETTMTVRVPISALKTVTRLIKDKVYKLPLYGTKIPAGFPSPADDHLEKSLDLTEHLIKHPAATFLVRATGNSMINAGIHENDILVVDRSIEPAHGRIAIVALDGQLTVKRLCKQGSKLFLMPENKDYQPIEITEGNDVHVWGIVTNVIHSL
jgi:DNA polymerase V